MIGGRRIFVIGESGRFASELHGALTGAGAASFHLDPSQDRRALAAEMISDGVPDAIVIVIEPSGPFNGRSLASTSPSDWDDHCEGVLRKGMSALQAAHDAFGGRTGRIVMVVPTAGISGAAELVGFTTAVEGMRAMAKSAARQWGSAGITVNAIAVPLGTLAPEAAALTSFQPAPAITGPISAGDLLPAITMLTGPDASKISGATVLVDGGSVMTP